MQKLDFHEAFSLVSQKLTDAEMGKKTGIARQTISKWHGMRTKPHRSKRDRFMRWYLAEIPIQNERDGVQKLLEKYVKQLPTTTYSLEWYDKEPKGFIEINLPWFFSGDFYWKTNRHGQKWNGDGWIRQGQDFNDYQFLFQQGRINEIIGLALL